MNTPETLPTKADILKHFWLPITLLFVGIAMFVTTLVCVLHIEHGESVITASSGIANSISYLKMPDGTQQPVVSEQRISARFLIDYAIDGHASRAVIEGVENARLMTPGSKVKVFVVRFGDRPVYSDIRPIPDTAK